MRFLFAVLLVACMLAFGCALLGNSWKEKDTIESRNVLLSANVPQVLSPCVELAKRINAKEKEIGHGYNESNIDINRCVTSLAVMHDNSSLCDFSVHIWATYRGCPSCDSELIDSGACKKEFSSDKGMMDEKKSRQVLLSDYVPSELSACTGLVKNIEASGADFNLAFTGNNERIYECVKNTAIEYNNSSFCDFSPRVWLTHDMSGNLYLTDKDTCKKEVSTNLSARNTPI